MSANSALTAVLFHSVLGVRSGVMELAQRIDEAGFGAIVLDQYDGRTFDDYDEASAYFGTLNWRQLISDAVDDIAGLPGPLVTVGFSNGGNFAEAVAVRRGGRSGGVTGTILVGAGLSTTQLGLPAWPGLPVQVHSTVDDPWREEEPLQAFLTEVRESGAEVEAYLDYPGDGHLFNDYTLKAEYDEASAELFYSRVADFLHRVATDRPTPAEGAQAEGIVR